MTIAGRLLLLLSLLLMPACGRDPALRTDGHGPALWRIEKGAAHGYLFGTVHALPEGVAWQTPALRDAIASSDRLVVEASGLDDAEMLHRAFEEMGRSPGLPPLPDRVPGDRKAALGALMREGGLSDPAMRSYESWAAALTLSTVIQKRMAVEGAQGVEAVLIDAFKRDGKSVQGLETVREQFSAFDRLPEDAQRRLLTDTVSEAGKAGHGYDATMRAWMDGDLKGIEREGMRGLTADPALAEALLRRRNAHWVARIDGMRGRPFIAIGAAHLAGPGNVASLLAARGWRISRVQ
jgi:uncharacterized protein YbaP (TraB family)